MFQKSIEKSKIYTIYNKVEDSYSPLDIARNDTVAIRRFISALNAPSQHVIYKKDYELYCLGEIDPLTFEIKGTSKRFVTDFNTEFDKSEKELEVKE